MPLFLHVNMQPCNYTPMPLLIYVIGLTKIVRTIIITTGKNRSNLCVMKSSNGIPECSNDGRTDFSNILTALPSPLFGLTKTTNFLLLVSTDVVVDVNVVGIDVRRWNMIRPNLVKIIFRPYQPTGCFNILAKVAQV